MKINDLLIKEDISLLTKKIILSDILNLTIPEISLNKEKEITKKEYKIYQKKINKIKKNIPVQYALGHANFYGYEFLINKNVLIPRPETEILVDETINIINKNFKNPNIIEVGTGSGIIPITIKKNINSNITATDISKKALKVAKRNAKKNNAKIKFIHTNILKKIKGEFDILISNPPYISKNEKIEDIVYNNEPHLALFAEDNGLYFYKKILEQSKNILNKKNVIIFEIGKDQSEILTKIVKNYYPKAKIIIKKDSNNFDRILIISNNIE